MTQKEADDIKALFFEKLEQIIVKKYFDYLKKVKNITCNLQKKTIGSLGKKVCHPDIGALSNAYVEMKNDIIFLMERRGRLIESLKPSFGKIAGIIAYRLAKFHIIHLQEGCASCIESCTVKKLNQVFALKCAWEYIGIKYFSIHEDMRKELFYSFSYRHVNQETLGLIFDAVIHNKNP